MTNSDDIAKLAYEARQKNAENLFAKAKQCLGSADSLFDLAKNEVIESRWETGAIAAIMAVKVYAAKQFEIGEAQNRFVLAQKLTGLLRGNIIINNKKYAADIIQALERKGFGYNAFLMASTSLDLYHLLGACYYSFYPQEFLAYNIPYSMLINYRKQLAGDRNAGPSFLSNSKIGCVIDTVGLIFAAMNCPEKIPVPWTQEKREEELKAPVNWRFFK